MTKGRQLTPEAQIASLEAELRASRVESKRALEAERQRAAELAVINSVMEGLASQMDIRSIFELVGNRISEIFTGHAVALYTYDAGSDLAEARFMEENGRRHHPPPFKPGPIGRHVIKTKKPQMISTNAEFKAMGAIHIEGTADSQSGIFAPLVVNDTIIGALNIESPNKEHAFSMTDLRLVTTISNSMGVAIENARLFDEVQKKNAEITEALERETAINEILRVIAESPTDIQPVLEVIAQNAAQLSGLEDAIIAIKDGDVLRVAAHYGDIPMIPVGEGIRFNRESVAGRAMIDGIPLQAIHNQDGTQSEYHEGDKIAKKYGYRMSSSVPLMREGKAVGVITIRRTEPELLTDKQVALIQSFANQAAIAVENVRLFNETTRLLKETEQRNAELAILNSVGEAMAKTLDVKTVAKIVGDKVRDIFHAEAVGIRLLDPVTKLVHPMYEYDKTEGGYVDYIQPFPLGKGVTSKIIQSRQPLLLNTLDEAKANGMYVPPEQLERGTGEWTQSALCVPIIVSDKALGAAIVSSYKPYAFNENDLRLLQTLASNMGVALENARLFQEVERQKDYSESLLINSPVAIVTVDKANHIVSWNPRSEALFGYTSDQAIGKNIDQLLVPEEMRQEAVSFNQQTEAKGSIQVTTKRLRKDGSLVDVELHGVALKEDRKHAGGIAIYHDISALKRTEDNLREQKEFFEAVLSSSPAAIAVADHNYNVIAWNTAAEELFGYSLEEALGRNIDDLVAADEDLRADAIRKGERIIREREKIRFITQRTRKDGSRVDVEVSAIPVVSGESNLGFIAIYYDISNLLEAQRAAEAANEAKSAFLATMSHEIRTPMNAIIGMSGLLLDTSLTPEQREFAEVIRNSGDALLGIINDILDFSKIEAGRMDLEEQPFDLRELLETSLDLIKMKASEKSLELAYLMEEDVPPFILGDATRLRQILINLLNNAVKFTEKGEVILSVHPEATGPETASLVSLHFSVYDTGIGIPAGRLDRLFQAFSQVDASTSRKYGGTGLGLAISKRLAEMMGGKMWVESVEGEGTTFHFTIHAQPAPMLENREHLQGEQPHLAGKRLLIVDDNATNRRILTLQTKNWGVLARATASPSEALSWIQRGDPFDLAILDMEMPEMDGLDLAAEIRTLRDENTLPLVLFSSITSRESGLLQASPFIAHLQKPLKQSTLFDTLISIFAGQTVKPVSPFKTGIDRDMARWHPLRILLTEDNAINQKVALRILDRMGYRADIAGNGLEAIEAIERQPYDVVLMDVQMPEMDGLEAARQICTRWRRGMRPRIIAMTANATQEDMRNCFEAGMDDYISKPIRVEDLAATLSRSQALEN